MTTMIQIRNVPDALHRRLKWRAALAGMSLSNYLLNEIREVAEGRWGLASTTLADFERHGIPKSVFL